VPAKTLAELIAPAKAPPGKPVFASTGLGGIAAPRHRIAQDQHRRRGVRIRP